MYTSPFFHLKKGFLCLVFIGFSVTLYAQKQLFKEWIAPSFSLIHIESDHISKITLRSHPADQISIFIRVEGETFENSMITVATTQDKLSIGTDFTPYFLPYNDKLAAHKVLAIEMIILLPECLKVSIRSSLANVYGWGSFNHLKTELETGFVQLDFFKGNATLYSKWGLIQVKALNGVSGSARSTYGKVTNLLPNKETYQIDAVSLHGTIELLQTKK